MPAKVYHNSMGRKTVVTTDKHGNESIYKFRPVQEGIGVEPEDGYTPVVLKALWQEGIPVDWKPEDLTPSERAQLKGFCDDCGTAIRSRQVAPDEWEYWCPQCE